MASSTSFHQVCLTS